MRINNENAFSAAIDTYGRLLAKIAALSADAKQQKAALEAYATGNDIIDHATAEHRFKMVKGSAALKRRPELSKSAVVSLLKSSTVMREFICEDYDADGIKDYIKSLKKSDQAPTLESYGLMLTEPKRHAEVKPRSATR